MVVFLRFVSGIFFMQSQLKFQFKDVSDKNVLALDNKVLLNKAKPNHKNFKKFEFLF